MTLPTTVTTTPVPGDLPVSVPSPPPPCAFCGQRLVPSGSTTGGGTLNTGETICNACAGWYDTITMASTEEGKRCRSVALYVEEHVNARQKGEPMWVGNWPGSLRLTVTSWTPWRYGGFGTKRRSIYFTGPLGSRWSGIEYNGMTSGTLVRGLRRIKP